MTSEGFYREAFQRNIGILTEEEQDRLRESTVAIAGLGGVGGLYLMTLARMGIGRFHIADGDTFEIANINRQYGATVENAGKNKALAMASMARSINPTIEIRVWEEGIDEGNVEAFLEGVDVVLDGIDFFAIEERRLLFKKARQKGIFAITSAPIGFGSTLQIFSPRGMDFDDYFSIRDDMDYVEKLIAFAVGLTPRPLHLRYMDLRRVDLSRKKGPAIASSCTLCASLVATEVLNILLKRRRIRAVPCYIQFDPYRMIYRKGYLPLGGRNPLQALKRWLLRRKVKGLINPQR